MSTQQKKNFNRVKIDKTYYLHEAVTVATILHNITPIASAGMSNGLSIRVEVDVVAETIKLIKTGVYNEPALRDAKVLSAMMSSAVSGKEFVDPLNSLVPSKYRKATTFCVCSGKFVKYEDNCTPGAPVESAYFIHWLETRVMGLILAICSYFVGLAQNTNPKSEPKLEEMFPASKYTADSLTLLKEAIALTDSDGNPVYKTCTVLADAIKNNAAMFKNPKIKDNILSNASTDDGKWAAYMTAKEDTRGIGYSVKHSLYVKNDLSKGQAEVPLEGLTAVIGDKTVTPKYSYDDLKAKYSMAVIYDEQGNKSMAAPSISVLADSCTQILTPMIFIASGSATSSMPLSIKSVVIDTPKSVRDGDDFTGSRSITVSKKAVAPETTATTSATEQPTVNVGELIDLDSMTA